MAVRDHLGAAESTDHLCCSLSCLFGRWLPSRVCPRHHCENLFRGKGQLGRGGGLWTEVNLPSKVTPVGCVHSLCSSPTWQCRCADPALPSSAVKPSPPHPVPLLRTYCALKTVRIYNGCHVPLSTLLTRLCQFSPRWLGCPHPRLGAETFHAVASSHFVYFEVATATCQSTNVCFLLYHFMTFVRLPAGAHFLGV